MTISRESIPLRQEAKLLPEQTAAGLCGAAGKHRSGWGTYSCTLLSPRGFMKAHGPALTEGRSAETLLTEELRTALAGALDRLPPDAARDSAEQMLREALYRAAMNNGWLLTDFRLKVLR